MEQDWQACFLLDGHVFMHCVHFGLMTDCIISTADYEECTSVSACICGLEHT